MRNTKHTAMRWVLAGLAVALCCSATASLDPARNLRLPTVPKFNPPQSGVLFATDFSDGMRGWAPDQDSVWSVHHGSLRADLPDGKQHKSFIFAGSASWTDYAVDVDVLGARGVDKGLAVRVEDEKGIGVDLRGPGYQDVLLHRSESKMGQADVQNANGTWHHIRIEARGNRYRVFVDQALLIDKEDPRNARPRGRIALAAYTGGVGECTVYFDNVVVTTLSPLGAR